MTDMQEDLQGKVALVTGGGTGIGAAIVERLALLGADVTCAYNKSRASAEALAEKLAGLGRTILPVKIDVSSEADVSNGIDAIARHFGSSVGILVNNAGDNINPTSVDKMEKELWDQVIGINLGGASSSVPSTAFRR